VIRAALVQMRSGPDIARNVADAGELIRAARAGGADFVSTPEMTNILEPDRPRLRSLARTEENDESVASFGALAKELAWSINQDCVHQ
jgi:predicted amidohydrolase